jgi:hypothetical protein
MKTDIYTKAILTAIAVLLSINVIDGRMVHSITAHAQAQNLTWEYKTISRFRDFGMDGVADKDSFRLHFAGQWNTWDEDGIRLGRQVQMPEKVKELGLQGWELVAIEGRSGTASSVYSGATNEEMWIFKRPMQ